MIWEVKQILHVVSVIQYRVSEVFMNNVREQRTCKVGINVMISTNHWYRGFYWYQGSIGIGVSKLGRLQMGLTTCTCSYTSTRAFGCVSPTNGT